MNIYTDCLNCYTKPITDENLSRLDDIASNIFQDEMGKNKWSLMLEINAKKEEIKKKSNYLTHLKTKYKMLTNQMEDLENEIYMIKSEISNDLTKLLKHIQSKDTLFSLFVRAHFDISFNYYSNEVKEILDHIFHRHMLHNMAIQSENSYYIEQVHNKTNPEMFLESIRFQAFTNEKVLKDDLLNEFQENVVPFQVDISTSTSTYNEMVNWCSNDLTNVVNLQPNHLKSKLDQKYVISGPKRFFFTDEVDAAAFKLRFNE